MALATRDRVLDAAVTVFLERGYTATTIRDVARHAGVSTGAIYNHFRNKAELLLAGAQRDFERSMAIQRDDFDPSRPPAATVARSAATYAGRRQVRALLLEAASAARHDRDVSAAMRTLHEQTLELWAGDVTAWQATGQLGEAVPAKVLVTLIWAAELGMALLEASGVPTPDPGLWGDLHERLVRTLEQTDDRRSPGVSKTSLKAAKGLTEP